MLFTDEACIILTKSDVLALALFYRVAFLSNRKPDHDEQLAVEVGMNILERCRNYAKRYNPIQES